MNPALRFRVLLAAAAVALVLFAALAAIVPADGPALFDEDGLRSLAAVRSAGLTSIFFAITNIGHFWAVVAVSLALVVLVIRTSRWAAAFVAITMVGGAALNGAMKEIFARVRPTLIEPVERLSSWSFPSGHSQTTLILFFVVFLVVRRLWPRFSPIVLGVGILLAIAVGLSRVYLGVHYPTDVLGGWSLGIAWVLGNYLWFRHACIRAESGPITSA